MAKFMVYDIPLKTKIRGLSTWRVNWMGQRKQRHSREGTEVAQVRTASHREQGRAGGMPTSAPA